MYDAKWDDLFKFDQRVLKVVDSQLPGKTSVQSSVGMGVGRLSWVEEFISEVGQHNCPPCLINQIFPKSVHLALGVLGVLDPVSIYLQDFNSREG